MRNQTLFLSSLVASFALNAQTLELPPLPILPPIPAASKAPLDVSFPYGQSVSDFARLIIQDVLKEPFLFSEEFIASKERVAFEKRNIKPAAAEQLLRDVLAERGYVLTRKNGFIYVQKKAEAQKPPAPLQADFIYRPKHRDLAYLSALIQPLFPSGFTFQRAVSNSTTTTETAGTRSTVTAGGSTGEKTVDDGSSAFSAQSRADLDAFIFRGTADDIARLKSLLEQLDTPVSRVLVRAYILEVGTGHDSGSSISLVSNVLTSRLSLTLAGSQLSNALTFKTPDVSAVFSALASDSRFSIRTAPALVTETGSTAKLQVGSSIPTLGAIQTLQGGQTQQSVQYQDVGTLLSISPRILDESISVTISQEISDAVKTTTGLSNTPTLNRRSISTSLSLQSGEWVVLGGLTSDKLSTAENRLPFFGFKLGTSDQVQKTDIVVLLYVERQ